MGVYHPEVVHFAIALLVVGVLFRAVSLVGWPTFISPAATALIVLGTLAAIAAAYTGDAAHGPVEAMPGLRAAVTEHEEWGERARNIFVLVALVELAAMALRRPERKRYALLASTIVGVIGLGVLYMAGQHGGEIVYAYAGGVGTRSGDPQDVNHLLRAGLYEAALADRNAGRHADAAALFDVAARRFPGDIEVQLARAESLLLDRKDAAAAVQALQAITPPADNRFIRSRHALLTADALDAAGQREGAVAVLQQFLSSTPNASPRVQQRLDQLKGGAPAPPR